MKRNSLRLMYAEFTEIFNFRQDDAKGRSITLASVVLSALYNVFITGLFYTGFLSMYGMSITDAGIVTFIPFIGNLFSVFSSKLLARFKRRKPVLIVAKVYFYAMYILATNVMPNFVADPQARLIWFAGIIFLAYAVYAPFSTGFTVWFYSFYPKHNERRTKFLLYQQALSTVMSSVVLIFSSILTDAVAGSPFQEELILGLRYFAFALVVAEIAIQACAKEPSYDREQPLQIRKVFTLPFRYRKFLYCMLLMFAWNYIANLPNGVWNYHLLNHMQFSYTLINAMSVMYTVLFLLLSNGMAQAAAPLFLGENLRHGAALLGAYGGALLYHDAGENLFVHSALRCAEHSQRGPESVLCQCPLPEPARGELHHPYCVQHHWVQSVCIPGPVDQHMGKLRHRGPYHAPDGDGDLFRAVHVPDAGGDHAGDGGCAREQMARVYPAGGY